MEETTVIQPLSKRRDMKNNIQAERYKCSPNHSMRKIIDDMTKHPIKKGSFIHKNNKLKKTTTTPVSKPCNVFILVYSFHPHYKNYNIKKPRRYNQETSHVFTH